MEKERVVLIMATYEYAGKEVSESEFKEKVYGKDSPQYIKSKDREEKVSSDISKAGSSGSNYVKKTNKDGSVEISNKSTGEIVQTKSKQEVMKDNNNNKNTVVIGLGKTKEGDLNIQNVGQYLTQEQKRQVAKLTGEKGRLNTRRIEQTKSINEKGETVLSRNVQFTYKEPVNKNPDYIPTTIKDSTTETKETKEKEKIELYAPKREGVPFQTTRTDMSDEINISGIFTLKGENKNLRYDEYVDTRSDLQKVKDDIIEKTMNQDSTSPFTSKEVLYSPVTVLQGADKLIVEFSKGIVVDYGIGTVRSFTVDLGDTFQGITDVVIGKTKVSQIYDSASKRVISNPARSGGAIFGALYGGKLIKSAITKYKAPKIIGESQGSTISLELVDDVYQYTRKTTTEIKSGSDLFKVDSVTSTIDKADDFGSRLQSSRTDLIINKIDDIGNVKNKNTGFSRSVVVVSKTDSGDIFGRGDLVQGVNLKDKSIITQSDLVTLGKDYNDISRVSTIVNKGLDLKTDKIKSTDDLSFVSDNNKKLYSIEESTSKKIIEYDTPIKNKVETEFGTVEIETGKNIKTSLYDDISSSRGGQYLSDIEKSSNIKVDPYSKTITENGVSIRYGESPKFNNPIDKSNNIINEKEISISISNDGSIINNQITKAKNINKVINPDTTISLSAVDKIIKNDLSIKNKVIDTVSQNMNRAFVVSSVSNVQNIDSNKNNNVNINTISNINDIKLKEDIKVDNKIVEMSFESNLVIPLQKNENMLVNINKSSNKLRMSQDSSMSNKLVQDNIIISDMAQDNSIINKLAQDNVVSQKTSQKSSLSNNIIQKSFLNNKISNNNLYGFPSNNYSRSEKNKSSGFDVFVRKSGVFKRVNKSALKRTDALDFGAFNVANSPQATFFIRSSGSALGSSPIKSRGAFSKFKQNFFKKGNLFIEKKEKRIKSSGEKAGITRLGILANKKKRMFKRFKK